jgi:hypothetical protein
MQSLIVIIFELELWSHVEGREILNNHVNEFVGLLTYKIFDIYFFIQYETQFKLEI